MKRELTKPTEIERLGGQMPLWNNNRPVNNVTVLINENNCSNIHATTVALIVLQVVGSFIYFT